MNGLEYLEKRSGHIIVYGAGPLAVLIVRLLNKHRISIQAVCDSNVKKRGTLFEGFEIKDFDGLHCRKDVCILVTPMKTTAQIIERLRQEGYLDVNGVEEIIDTESLEELGFQGSRKNYLEYCKKIYSANMENKEGKLFLRYVDFSVTEKCSLRCIDCANLMTYFEKPIHYKVEMLKKSLFALSESVDKIITLAVIGGEPFVYPQLEEFLRYAASFSNIVSILILTNGTIVPKPNIMKALKECKVVVFISNYGEVSGKSRELMEELDAQEIPFQCDESFYWNDLGSIEEPHSYSDEETDKIYNLCSLKECCAVGGGVFSGCPRLVSLKLLGKCNAAEDYINLLDEDINSSERRKKIQAMMERDRGFQGCRYCKGNILEADKIKPAIQKNSQTEGGKDED